MTPTMYSIRDVATLYGITTENARQWAIEFAAYLSPTASPGGGKKRAFTDEDMQVFDLVARAKKEGHKFEEIHAALQSGQRGQAPQLPPQDIHALALVEGERRLLVQVDRLNDLLATRSQELQRVTEELEKTKAALVENARLQAQVEFLEADRQQLQAQAKELAAKVEALAERAGREYAKGYVDALREAGDRPGEDKP